MSINDEYVEARIREINDAIQMLKQLTTKDFGELTVYEKFSLTENFFFPRMKN